MFGGLTFYDGQEFDTALTPSQAYSLAAPMIKNCPSSNPALNKNDGGPLTRATLEVSCSIARLRLSPQNSRWST